MSSPDRSAALTGRHEQEREPAQLPHIDELTGTMNRWRLSQVLETTIENAIKLRSSCGFLLVGIDGLRHVKEAYGLDVADEAIAAVAQRVRSQMRGRDHLGRFSGSKLGIILNDCTGDDLAVAADRVLTSVRAEVVATTAGPVAVTAAIGGVTAPRYARTVRDVFARAHDALDGAKLKRRGAFLAYAPNPERDARRRANVRATEEIIAALNARSILLAYEPVVAVGTRAPAFYQCVMQIRRPDGRLAEVGDMVPFAEHLGLARLLDRRVLELALADLVEAPELRASVNVSAASTADPDWWGAFGAMLRAHPGIGERLTLGISEAAAADDLDETRGVVARARDFGCRIAMEDFGAGYTTFRDLRKLGVDLVKIDGVLVQKLRRCDDDRAFAHTLIDLARRLGLETVAEGVRDKETAVMLADWGCDYLQGELVGLASGQRPWCGELLPQAASF